MKIGDIDSNLKVETKLPVSDLKWITPTETPISLHGIYAYTEEYGFLRMPKSIADATNEGVSWLARNTAGGRIRFKTNSKYIAIKITVTSDDIMPHITAVGQAGFDLYKTENHVSSYIQSYMPYSGRDHGYESIAYTDGQMHTYTLNMPLYSDVKTLYIGFDPDCTIEKADDYLITQPVLYYGSSITQGGCASRPGNAYQAMISRRFDCDFINLGFSGSARGEQVMADYLASLDPSVFVLDYDHNAPNSNHLRDTHEPLFKTFRNAHPDTPVIMVSKPDINPHNNEDILRREIIRTTYQNALDAGDKNVYFIDGETLFNGNFRDSCTVDGCHPNDLGFFRMAEVIGDVLEPILKGLN